MARVEPDERDERLVPRERHGPARLPAADRHCAGLGRGVIAALNNLKLENIATFKTNSKHKMWKTFDFDPPHLLRNYKES